MSGNLAEWLTAIRRQLLADKKKTAVLAVLFAALLIIVGRLFVSPSTPAPTYASLSQPIAAAAAASPSAPDSTKPVVVAQPPSAVKPTIPPTEPALGAVAVAPYPGEQNAKAAPANTGRVAAVDDLPRMLERDLFSTNAWSKFPSAGRFGMSPDEAGAAESPPTSSGGVWRQLTNVLGQYQETRKEELDRLDGDLAALKLQSTVTGPTPMAYISGRLVREGDIIGGFTVLHVKERRVTVRKFGLTRELRMP
jgi:hypothetical protein